MDLCTGRNIKILRVQKAHILTPVCRAVDVASKRQVAIKIVENIEENIEEVLQEYQILTDHSLHPNITQL